ncbi:MAG: PQQ-binding-like beta-propeller repeat protein [Phycisphaera sp.]|nr:PQQ-binding-like beta-propeller repeat protein [Phycisphaera sp.]
MSTHTTRRDFLAAAAATATYAAVASPARAAMPDGRYLYMAMPDGAQTQNRSGVGILVFDIDNGHKLVKRYDVPGMKEGIRGMTGCGATACLYWGTTNHRLGCFDLNKGEAVWEKTYPLGCDRSCITPDGKTLYSPTGWWYAGDDGGFIVIDPATGEMIKRIEVGPQAHNSIASLDGRYVYLGTRTMLTQFNAADGSIVKQIKPVGESGVFPYTVNGAQTTAYVCLGQHVGVDIVDLTRGEVTHRLLAHEPDGDKTIGHRTHGAGLTPDESELWISDQVGKRLFIYDATTSPPTPKGHVELSSGGHGWVCFSLDGQYAWPHTPDVFDARTKQRVTTLSDESGKPVAGSKFIEVHFKDGQVSTVGCEFGLGRK